MSLLRVRATLHPVAARTQRLPGLVRVVPTTTRSVARVLFLGRLALDALDALEAIDAQARKLVARRLVDQLFEARGDAHRLGDASAVGEVDDGVTEAVVGLDADAPVDGEDGANGGERQRDVLGIRGALRA